MIRRSHAAPPVCVLSLIDILYRAAWDRTVIQFELSFITRNLKKETFGDIWQANMKIENVASH